MEATVCEFFVSYVKESRNIFDIMAVAYKMICPFEPVISIAQDSELTNIIMYFSEQSNRTRGLAEVKQKLIEWFRRHENSNISDMKKKLFFLVRLIDNKCVKAAVSSLPDSYIQYFSLNQLFQNEIIIVPRLRSNVIELLSATIARAEGHGFYGRNHSATADISGYLHNFIIYRKSLIKPRIVISNYCDEIKKEFEQKSYKLKVGIFPLSNINLRCLFSIKEDIMDKEGVFRVEDSNAIQEQKLLERCIEALKICRKQGVDIAVFPEMLFSKKMQKAIIEFVKENEETENRFPWFMWLGTTWAERENKCMVIDQYGKVVFEQKKFVPYEYKRKSVQNIGEKISCKEELKGSVPEGRGGGDILTIREDLSHEEDWIVNYLDIPCLFRIATAICRDISSDLLKDSVKQFCTDMMIIPAFSESDRLTNRNIDPLVLEHIIVVVCNACSALCGNSRKKFEVTKEMLGTIHPFCYLCMPAKQEQDNQVDYHRVEYTEACLNCESYCSGYLWDISFSECIKKNDSYCATIADANCDLL